MKNKFLFLFVGFLCLCSFTAAWAEVKTFDAEFAYKAERPDNKASARALASAGVKDRLWKDLWTYLEDLTPVKNLKLTAEQMATFIPALAPIRFTAEKWDGRTYRISAHLTVETSDLPQSLRSLARDEAGAREWSEIRKQREAALGKMTVLKQELSSVPARTAKRPPAAYLSLVKELAAADGLLEGYLAEKAENWAEAKKAFDRVLEADRDNESARYHRGMVFLRLGKSREAITDFTRIIQADSDKELAFYMRGMAYILEKKEDQAIADFSRAIELNGKFGPAYYQRGLALDRKGNREEALRDLTKAIELNPEDSQFYFNRGAIYAKLGYQREAARDLAAAVRLDQKKDLTAATPELPEKIENRSNAINELDLAIAKNPNNAEAYYKRGMAYDSEGNYQKALQDFNKAIELDPKDAAAYFMRGLVYGMIDVSYDSVKDIKVSARLGYKPAQEYMKARGMFW